MSSLYQEDFDIEAVGAVFNAIMSEIHKDGLKLLDANLDRQGIEMTENLRKSLHREIRAYNQLWVYELVLEFEAYGRFQDMRQLSYTKHMPVTDRLIEWAKMALQKRRRGAFEFISGVKPHGTMPANLDKAARNLAWAVAKSRLYKPVVINRNSRGWYIRDFMKKVYAEIGDKLNAAAAEAALMITKRALEGKIK